jgi:hypothetical protein
MASVETSMTTHNIVEAISASGDPLLINSLPDGVVVYTIESGGSSSGVSGQQTVETVEEGVSTVLIVIVAGVCSIIVIGLAILIFKCRSAMVSMPPIGSTMSVVGQPERVLENTYGLHRDEDLFRVLPFSSLQFDISNTPFTQSNTLKVLDYTMLDP